MTNSEKKKFLDEFSKRAYVTTFCAGVFCIVAFWIAVFLGRAPSESTLKMGIDLTVYPFFGYITYQLGLKSSLNRYGLFVKDGVTRKIGS